MIATCCLAPLFMVQYFGYTAPMYPSFPPGLPDTKKLLIGLNAKYPLARCANLSVQFIFSMANILFRCHPF